MHHAIVGLILRKTAHYLARGACMPSSSLRFFSSKISATSRPLPYLPVMVNSSGSLNSRTRSASARLQNLSLNPVRFASGVAGPLTATHTATAGAQKHEDHVKHWQLDRILHVLLLPLIPAAFLTDNVYVNYALIMCVGAHVHWGMESVVVDYMRPAVVGKAGYFISLGLLYVLSFATFAGLFYLNYSQMPPTKAIKKLWREV